MDPYLEHPVLWPGVHSRLIAALDEDLSAQLLPRYYVEVEERVYVADVQMSDCRRSMIVPATAIASTTAKIPSRLYATKTLLGRTHCWEAKDFASRQECRRGVSATRLPPCRPERSEGLAP